jgi:hypothetical protein
VEKIAERVLTLAQAIHDADLEDGKFGRHEGHAMNQILRGWAAQSVPDDQLLRRGLESGGGVHLHENGSSA